MEAAERDAAHALEGLNLGVPHRLERLDVLMHYARAALQCAGAADQQAQVYIDGRVLGGAADREVTELDCSQVPEGLGEPEISFDFRRVFVWQCGEEEKGPRL